MGMMQGLQLLVAKAVTDFETAVKCYDKIENNPVLAPLVQAMEKSIKVLLVTNGVPVDQIESVIDSILHVIHNAQEQAHQTTETVG